MIRSIFLIYCLILLNSCIESQQPNAINLRYTPDEARRQIIWWAENIRPNQRSFFEKALVGDHDSLRRILNDTDNSFGPPDQDGEPASALSGAFLLALGDNEFAEFICSESDAVKRSVFGSFTSGPWSLAYDEYTVPADAESSFSKMFPRTAKIRSRFYKENIIRDQQPAPRIR